MSILPQIIDTGVIWKFPIPFQDEFSLAMRKGAELLFVGAQGDHGFLWARVAPDRERESRTFRLRGTGHQVDLNCKYVGSFIIQNGALVFHLFEVAS